MDDLTINNQSLFAKTDTSFQFDLIIEYQVFTTTDEIIFEIDQGFGGPDLDISTGDIDVKLANWTHIVCLYEYLTDVSRSRIFSNGEYH